MGKVDGFSEAPAVHLGVENDKEKGEQGEESLEGKSCNA